MNTKIIAVAGVIFAIAFVAIFMITYNSGKGLLGSALNSYYDGNASMSMIDCSYLEGRKVTYRSIGSLKRYIDINKVYDTSLADITITSPSSNGKYTVTLTRENNKIKSIKFN